MISIVIPALNEEVNLRASVETVIKAAKAANDTTVEIILVNDGSADKTGGICDQIAAEYSFISAVHHQSNMGQGAAIMDGLRLAKYDRLTMVPGDNVLPLFTLRNLFLNRDRADYVLAMVINHEYRSHRRILLSAIYSHIYTTTFRIPIKYINSVGLWPTAKLREMGLHARRYSLHGEINVKLLRQPISFVEIDGYMNPSVVKSSALKPKNVVEVVRSYLRLCFEIFVTHRDKYSSQATRVLPPGVIDSGGPQG